MQITRVHWMIGIALALGAVLYFDMAEAPSPPSGSVARAPVPRTATTALPTAAAGSGTAATANPLSQLRITELSETIARPLFEPSRRMIERARPAAAPPPVSAPPPPSAEPSFKLLGVIINPDRSLAILSTDNGRPQRLEVGDSLNGWRVGTITVDEVVLSRGGSRQSLRVNRR